MNHAITIELQFFLISILWGGLLLLVYDGLRIIRRIIKHDSFFVAVEDLIFWVAASLFIFIMMYNENNGIIRGFSVMGMAIGMVLYHYIFSELLVNGITKLIRTLFRPFAIAFGWIKRFTLYLLSIGKKIVKILLRRLKKWRKSVKIALNIRKQKMDIKQKKHLEKKELEKIEQEKKAAVKQAVKKKEIEKKEASKKEASKKEADKKEASKKEAGKKEASKKETGKKEADKKEADKKEAGKKEAGKKEAGKKEASKKETIKKTADNKVVNKKVSEKNATTNVMDTKKVTDKILLENNKKINKS